MTNAHINTDLSLLSIIEDIYDTTFDPSLWRQTLTRVVDYADALAAGIISKNRSGELRVQHPVGISSHFVQTYIDGYGECDPTHAIRLLNVGELHSVEDWLPAEEFSKTQFYQEWARPQHIEDIAGVLLDRSADGFSYFVLATREIVDDRIRRRLMPVIPHLLRAVLIGQVLHQHAAVASPIIQTLDELKAAMFLLDCSGNITHSNESGRDMLAGRDFLRTDQGRLVATDPQLNRILRDATATSVLGGSATRSESIALPFIAQDGERFVGHLLPLTSGRRRKTGIAYEASAVLFVAKASLDAAVAADIIKDIFKLTPAEARVLLTVVEFGGVSETARNLDVAESTVKTHLGRIFTKTETRRQADLVKLVAAFSSPARG